MTSEAEKGAAQTTVQDHLRNMLDLMKRGARINLTNIPNDPTFLSSNIPGEMAKEIAAHIERLAALQSLAALSNTGGDVAQPVPAVPDGWVMVPQEPTETMLDAGADAADGHFAVDADAGPWLRSAGYAAVYTTMLSSPPPSPQPETAPDVVWLTRKQIIAELERLSATGDLCVWEMADDRGLEIEEYADLIQRVNSSLRQPDAVDEVVKAVATLYGNYLPGHGWTGFGPSPEKIAAALRQPVQIDDAMVERLARHFAAQSGVGPDEPLYDGSDQLGWMAWEDYARSALTAAVGGKQE